MAKKQELKNKKETIEPVIVNEKYITAQILSQSMDRVYKIFKNNLKSKKNKTRLSCQIKRSE